MPNVTLTSSSWKHTQLLSRSPPLPGDTPPLMLLPVGQWWCGLKGSLYEKQCPGSLSRCGSWCGCRTQRAQQKQLLFLFSSFHHFSKDNYKTARRQIRLLCITMLFGDAMVLIGFNSFIFSNGFARGRFSNWFHHAMGGNANSSDWYNQSLE